MSAVVQGWTTVAVAGLILHRDDQHRLHSDQDLPEAYTVTASALQMLRLRFDPAAHLTADGRLVVRTVEFSAVYVLSPMDRDGMAASGTTRNLIWK